MSGALSPEQINAITHSITLLRASSYVTVAIAACFVCDIIFSFGEEVTLVWPSRWSLTKGLYFYNRYSPFLDVFVVIALLVHEPSPKSCLIRNEIMGYLLVIGGAVSEGIIMMRTFALWNRNKLVMWVFLFLIITIPITNIIITNKFFRSLKYGPSPSPVLIGCFATQQGNLVWVSFTLFLAMESVVVSLTLYKGIDHVQTVKTRLVFTLYEDGLMYYLFFFVITLANIVLYFAGPQELLNTLALPSRVIHSILATHVILRIRACMRDRQLRQAGRPVGSTWLPAQYTGELDTSFSVAQVTSQGREYDLDIEAGLEDGVEGRRVSDPHTDSAADTAGARRSENRTDHLRVGSLNEEEDRGEGSSKLADSITLEDLQERGVRRKSSEMENGKGKKPSRFGFESGRDDDEGGGVDEDAPFSFTSITFADTPYTSEEQTVDFQHEEHVARDATHFDTPATSPGLKSSNTTIRPSSFWSSIRRVLLRRRPKTKNRGSSEALTHPDLPSPLPKASIELQPLPSFA